jgi:hypothetical protein
MPRMARLVLPKYPHHVVRSVPIKPGAAWGRKPLYFKARAYVQDTSGDSKEGARVTFAKLDRRSIAHYRVGLIRMSQRSITFLNTLTIPVGAGLARDGGVSVNIFGDRPTAIAGKPGSHRGTASYRAVAVNQGHAYSSPRRRH